jgi:2-phosphosulfolactate phosphatase
MKRGVLLLMFYFCPMQIDIIPYASAIRPDLIKNRTVVVIDVLRASSVMITALANGAKAFIPVESVEEARRKAQAYPADEIILAGERNTKLIEGFHLGNSPLDYTSKAVKGKSIILTTSNGTKALNRLEGAGKVLIGAFINLKAISQQLLNHEEVVFVCSGTNNNFSMDDAMCAAAITDHLRQHKSLKLSDMALTMHKAFQTQANNLRLLLNDCYHLNLLIGNGFENDVNYCLQKSVLQYVPTMDGNKIIR